MKKIIYLLLTIFLIPIFVNAETLTYDVCESGCEYASLDDVSTAINNISDLTDKDIVINVNSDDNTFIRVGGIYNSVKSVTVNGNNHDFDDANGGFAAKKVVINGCNNIRLISFLNSEKISIENSNIEMTELLSLEPYGQIESNENNLSDILEIDETSRNNLKVLALGGIYKIENVSFNNLLLFIEAGITNIYHSKLNKILNTSTLSIYNSEVESIFNREYNNDNNDINVNIYETKLGKIINFPEENLIITNIYNSKFNSLKYVNITSEQDEAVNELIDFINSYENYQPIPNYNTSMLNYDIYDIDFEGLYSNTTVYFDKQSKLKPGDKLNLVNYLDYYTEDKEIEYTIEDESIAKIENKELIGLKEGSTNVTVTTDEGHVIYRINLVVEKESLPEKIDKMTIKVPITGSKIKAWIIVVSAMLLGIVGVCIGMLVKNKKR